MDPNLLLLVVLVLVFWLLVLRPQAKRAKAFRELQQSLAVGDAVMLTSGIFGTVVELRDPKVLLSLAPGVEIEVVRAAVAEIIRPEADAVEESEGSDEAQASDEDN